MKTWTKPEYQLIDMNAEIGSYQEDFGDERDPVASVAAAAVGDGDSAPSAAMSEPSGLSVGGAAA